MALSTNLERLGNGNSVGCAAPGMHRQIIQSVGATRTLLPEESGAICLFDRAAGNVYTLPTPAEGMEFWFATTVTVTSGAAKVITATVASEFIIGTLFGYTTDATEIDGFSADGSTIVAVSSNGSTTGGVIGDYYRLTAISSTKWLIDGHIFCGTSTPATPFATS